MKTIIEPFRIKAVEPIKEIAQEIFSYTDGMTMSTEIVNQHIFEQLILWQQTGAEEVMMLLNRPVS